MVNLQVLVDGKRRVVQRLGAGNDARGHFGVARGDLEAGRGKLNGVSITVAAGKPAIQHLAGGQLVQVGVGAVLGEVHALGLGQGVEVHLHADGGNCLRGGLAGSRRRALGQVELRAQDHERDHQDGYQGAHILNYRADEKR